ncbi:MAG: DUF2934 domain-containing protein [Candidatus Nitrotoga sp.]|nr:DUF2934 domain-containing protein [Candidatus Nitrotoga sp.]
MIPIGANGKTAENPPDISPFDLDLQPSDEEWISRIAEFADYKAEARGFLLGYELNDWLAAEAEGQ